MAAQSTGQVDESRAAFTAEMVLEIVTAASGERDLDQILASTLDRLGAEIALTGGSIALVEGDELVVRAAVGPFAEEALTQRLRRGVGQSWKVVESRQPFLTGDLAAAGLGVRSSARAEAAIRSWLGVPIIRGNFGIGILEIDSIETDAFGPDDVELLSTVARALAGPIDLARRHDAEVRANRLRDAFIGVISHELRTPITTIYGTSSMLRRRAATISTADHDAALADIEAEADRLRRLVEDLLVISRAETGNVEFLREPVLLGHVVRRVVEEERKRWPTRTFEVEIVPGLPIVEAEETHAEQVVRNLLTNAAKYSPDDATIEVRADRTEAEVVVTVRDRGIGIAGVDPETLFELFYRSPGAVRQASGAGIGLFVCRELVRAMRGRIWASPRDGGGSEFGFAIPIATPSPGDSWT